MNPVFPFGPYLFKALKINIALIYILPREDRNAAINVLHQAHKDGETPFKQPYTLQFMGASRGVQIDYVRSHERILLDSNFQP